MATTDKKVMDRSIPKVVFGNETRSIKLNGFKISCYILSNRDYVLTKTTAQKALGYEGKSENWLHDLLVHLNKFFSVSEMLELLDESYTFEMENEGSVKFTSIDPILFIDICHSLVKAKKEGFLSVGQLKYAKAAEKLLLALNKDNIIDIIDETCGFNFYKKNTIEHFSSFLTTIFEDNAFAWIRTFPEEFFAKLLETNNSDWRGLRENRTLFAKVIHDIIFSRIAGELLLSLRISSPKRTYQRKKNLPQDNQHPKLKEYIAELLLLLATSAGNWNIFLQLLNRAHPKNPDFVKFPKIAEYPNEELSPFNQILKLMS